MLNFFKKKYCFAIIYTIIMIAFTAFVALDALVIEKKGIVVKEPVNEIVDYNEKAIRISDDYYEDENIKIELTYDRVHDSNFYIADIVLRDNSYFKTAFAKNTYGRNILDEVFDMATEHNAIFGINGDYFGFRDFGYVNRNGRTFRTNARPTGKDSVLVVYDDGSMNTYYERQTKYKEIEKEADNAGKKIMQVFTFGPVLIKDYEVQYNSEVEDLTVNPRTCIGIIENNHYVVVVVDGRQEGNPGVTLEQLTDYMLQFNCSLVYNLDGGSSTSMYFNGRTVNKPSNGIERPVSDLVYIGY